MIPVSFLERFLWSPQSSGTGTSRGADSPDSTPDGHVPKFTFSKAVVSELNALVSLAFSKTQKPPSDDTAVSYVPAEKCLVLSCSQVEGTQVIDEAVRQAATAHGADVLVLDALELVAGKHGLLGKGGDVIDEMYAPILEGSTPNADEDQADTVEGDASTKPSLSERARTLIDALLSSTIPPAQLTTKRIIYMRDFQIISSLAKPLMTYILQSLQEARVKNTTLPTGTLPEPGDEDLQPSSTLNAEHPQNTILIFGSNSDSLSIGNTPHSATKSGLFLNCLLTTSWTAIANRSYSGCTCSSWQPWGSPSPSVSLEDIPYDSEWGMRVDKLASDKLSMAIFASNVKSGASEETWQTASKVNKIRRLNQLVLRARLEREGCVLKDEDSDIAFVEKSDSETLVEIEDANTVVTIAMGLIAAAPLADSEPTPTLSQHILEAYKTFEGRKKERSDWESGLDPSQTPEISDKSEGNLDDDSGSVASEKPAPPVKDTYDDVSGHARDLLGCMIDTEEISTTFSDVFVDEAIMDSLQTIVTLPLLYPDYFNSGVLAKEAIGGILLYGPPGTGKTMLCRALAKTSHAKMLHIKPSDINEKYVGEAEKKVTAVFELAHRLAPCIVFIDEIDSLFSTRNDNTRTWERNILTEFMQGMDGLRSAKRNKDNNVMVVGATNRPFDLDLAILRRMPRRIMVDMPNLEMRANILGSYLKDENLDGVDIQGLAEETNGFSGSDLKNLCVAAALSSVKEAIGPEWKSRERPPPKAPAKTEGDGTEAEKAEPLTRTITAANIRQARSDISRSIVGNRGDELYKWHEKYSVKTSSPGTASSVGANGPPKPLFPLPSKAAGTTGHWNRWANPSPVTLTKTDPRD